MSMFTSIILYTYGKSPQYILYAKGQFPHTNVVLRIKKMTYNDSLPDITRYPSHSVITNSISNVGNIVTVCNTECGNF